MANSQLGGLSEGQFVWQQLKPVTRVDVFYLSHHLSHRHHLLSPLVERGTLYEGA